MKCLWILLGAQILTGCALTKDEIGLSYRMRGSREKVAGAPNVKVDVRIADQRPVRDIVGRKINGWGSEMGPIVSTNDVVELVRSAIAGELEMRGFSRGDSVVVSGDLNKFYNRFKAGFWAGDSIAEVILNVQVKARDGTIVFAKNVVAEGLEPNIQVAAGHNAKASLEMALAKVVEQLFQDPAFLPALFKAAGEKWPADKS